MIDLKAIRETVHWKSPYAVHPDIIITLLDRLEAAESQLAIYEKHGVTCQTFRHKLTGCAECNRDDAMEAAEKALAEPVVEPSTDDSSVLSACQKLAQAFKTSPPPPAEPAVKPCAWVVTGTGLFSIGPERPFDDDVWEPLYTSPPPPAEPARTSQDVCTVPLLSDEEILQLTPLWFKKYTDGVLLGHVRAIEQLVRRKAGL